jgi:hypothetical protein
MLPIAGAMTSVDGLGLASSNGSGIAFLSHTGAKPAIESAWTVISIDPASHRCCQG